MKLLILTQKVDINDGVLGFMHGWIAEFAKHCESVIVVCLYKGEYDLPANVKVLSLGKELRIKNYDLRIKNFFYRFFYLFHFYKYIWYERKNYDKVFVHMNSEYVVLGGLLWRLWRKKIGLWYVHKAVNWKLKLAEKLVNKIFTASKESFRLSSKKVKVMGHGIDVNKFKIQKLKVKSNEDEFKIITVGRISPVKDYETLIRAAEILAKDGVKFKVDIIGGAGTPEQEGYFNELKKMASEKGLDGIINFLGPVPNKDIAVCLRDADLFVNMSHTGSLDKAILEAMAAGLPVLTCNEAFINVLGDYRDMLIYPKGDYNKLAERIKFIFSLSDKRRDKMGDYLRNVVVRNHSLNNFIDKIVNVY